MIKRWWALYKSRPIYGDVLGAFLLSPFTFLATFSIAARRAPMAATIAMAVLFTVPLVLRRTKPDFAAAGIVAAHLIQLVTLDTVVPGNVTVPIVIYAVAVYGRPSHARWWLATALVGCLLGAIDWSVPDSSAKMAVQFAAWMIALAAVVLSAWFAGQSVRSRKLAMESLRERADALERERDRDRELAAAEERERIAREMHDVVAHSLSVIVVQADGAGYLASADSLGDADARLAQVSAAIATIGATARGALTETRRLVGVLRQDGDQAELAPAASLAAVDDLVANVKAAGLPVTLSVSGDPGAHRPYSAGAEMAAYRVVQESLTNVLKHGGPAATVTVTLHHDADGLDLQVADTGRGPHTSDGAGHGLIGMRERMAAWGGTLTARSRIGGGFEVIGHLPAPTDDSSERTTT